LAVSIWQNQRTMSTPEKNNSKINSVDSDKIISAVLHYDGKFEEVFKDPKIIEIMSRLGKSEDQIKKHYTYKMTLKNNKTAGDRNKRKRTQIVENLQAPSQSNFTQADEEIEEDEPVALTSQEQVLDQAEKDVVSSSNAAAVSNV